MIVNYNYLPQEFSDTTEIFKEWKALIQSTDFTLGKYVNDFETIFADYIGAKHCISTNNGTDALILSLRALGIGPGDEVISVTNTFYATIGAIVACGATPVLVDADDRFQISVKAIEAAITKRTKAILPVHWAGASPDISAIMELANSNNIAVVEDACMGIGAKINDLKPGVFGKISAFSMHPLKSLNVMGDGGMVITDCDDLATWMKKYRNHGMIDRDHIDFWGVNMRIQPLQAIVAMHRLKFLDQTIDIRNRNANILDGELSNLKEFVSLPERKEGNKETFALYMGLFQNRDKLVNFMNSKGVEVKIHYPVPLHKQKAATNKCIISPNMAVAEKQANMLMTLPTHQYLDERHMEYTISCIKSFYLGD